MESIIASLNIAALRTPRPDISNPTPRPDGSRDSSFQFFAASDFDKQVPNAPIKSKVWGTFVRPVSVKTSHTKRRLF